jgi:hypothetical protein
VSFEEFARWWDVNKHKKTGFAGSVVAKGAKLKGVAPAQSHHRWTRRWFVIDGFELVYYKVRSCLAIPTLTVESRGTRHSESLSCASRTQNRRCGDRRSVAAFH